MERCKFFLNSFCPWSISFPIIIFSFIALSIANFFYGWFFFQGWFHGFFRCYVLHHGWILCFSMAESSNFSSLSHGWFICCMKVLFFAWVIFSHGWILMANFNSKSALHVWFLLHLTCYFFIFNWLQVHKSCFVVPRHIDLLNYHLQCVIIDNQWHYKVVFHLQEPRLFVKMWNACSGTHWYLSSPRFEMSLLMWLSITTWLIQRKIFFMQG